MNPFNVCKTNPDCKRDPEKCEYAIRNIFYDDIMMEKDEYFCGRTPCPNMWKKRNK